MTEDRHSSSPQREDSWLPAAAGSSVLEVLSDGINQLLGASPGTLQGWNCTSDDTGGKEPPTAAGGGRAGYCEATETGDVFVYHEEGTTRHQRRKGSVGSSQDAMPPAAAAAEGGVLPDVLPQSAALTQTLLANTFFAAQGRSLQQMLESKPHLRRQFADAAEWRAAVLSQCGGLDVRVPTLDGRSLDAIWVPARTQIPPSAPKGCVVFHPNFAVCLDMVQYAVWYRGRGFGVLLITMGGYAESHCRETSEMSTYFDAHAAVQYVRQVRAVAACRIVCHGVSIGGALASAAACLHPGVHCTVDQTFVTAREVAEELLSSLPDWKRHTPKWLIATFISAVFPDGVCDQRLPGICTDGYDNLEKAAGLRGNYFAIYSSEDSMMPKGYAERLVERHYHSVIQQCRTLEVQQHDTELMRVWLMKLGWYTAQDATRGFEDLKGKLQTVCEQACLAELSSRHIACIKGGHHGSFFADDISCESMYANYLESVNL